jgi:hypothetical protein
VGKKQNCGCSSQAGMGRTHSGDALWDIPVGYCLRFHEPINSSPVYRCSSCVSVTHRDRVLIRSPVRWPCHTLLPELPGKPHGEKEE